MTKNVLPKPFYLGKFILLTLMLLWSATFLNAQTATFAQFLEVNGSNDFAFSNSGSGASFNTISGGSAITFVYQNIAGLPPELQGNQAAHIYVYGNTNTPAFINAGRTVQPLSQTFTIQILRDEPSSQGSGMGMRTNLLTATVTSSGSSTSDLTGDSGGSAAAYTATTPNQMVTYTSDFLDFSAPLVERNLALSFSSVNPAFNVGGGGFLTNFTAAGSGTFASNPGPTYNPPTAAPSMVSGRVLNSQRRGVANARVMLTNSSGQTFAVRTNSFGYYKFSDIESGQTVIISVFAKQYTYTPRVLNISAELDGMDFMPQ